MNSLMGESKPYVKPDVFKEAHIGALKAALAMYAENATMGSDEGILKFREGLINDIEEERARYNEVNSLKNPYRDLERFMVPIAIGSICWVLALFFDFFCQSDRCELVEDMFERVYMFVAFGILVLAYNNPFKDATMYSMPLVIAIGAWFMSVVVNSTCSSESCKVCSISLLSVLFTVSFSILAAETDGCSFQNLYLRVHRRWCFGVEVKFAVVYSVTF
jgi:hypothetical protein